MLKEAIFIFFAVVAVSLAYPAEEALDGQPKVIAIEVPPNQEDLETEGLEGAESAYPQWGHRGWSGGYRGGYGYGHGGGWGGGYGRGWGGGYGRGGYGHWGHGWGR